MSELIHNSLDNNDFVKLLLFIHKDYTCLRSNNLGSLSSHVSASRMHCLRVLNKCYTVLDCKEITGLRPVFFFFVFFALFSKYGYTIW